ncbi:3-oxoacyl-(acyl carrier protein) synthase 2 [Candidatus Xenohaliotis californiensis]|uniref:3-oxoacyl-[acyl-carrier-protein] synthase 2 n=1 Tax=Candidatus Xenohaliotis californiensis TaxID=84677 RepID=A0ABP0ET60_9RICK|nr:3-oxoacyl-(acyl carrier protein) synthase 2 [Candidatus Xenohaliotis californiensis]
MVNKNRRVMVTGLGMVTPVGINTKESWNNLINGTSGITKIDQFDASSLPCRIAAPVKYKSDSNPDGFDPSLYLTPKERRKVDNFILLGIAAADQAINDSGWKPENDFDRAMTSVVFGSGIGGLPQIEEVSIKLHEFGFRKVSPFFIPSTLINLLPGHVSIRHKYCGANFSAVSACSTGSHAIGEAAMMIRHGRANVVVAGGAEAALCPIAVAGFAAGRALSTKFNDQPENASRPWDKDRDGFIIGEGAGVLILEDYEHARKRDAKIYAELIGYGVSSDAHHITAPPESGVGAISAMKNAANDANVDFDDIDYLNAHGTSTTIGDLAELNAVMSLFKLDKRLHTLYMSSIKSSIGHLLGAAGGVEAVATVLSIANNIVPPTLNLQNPILSHKNLDLVPMHAKSFKVQCAMSNSFGFGGTNASLLFAQYS